MQKKQQLLSRQDHKGCKLTHFCIEGNSKNRYWCHKCMNKDQHVDCYECWDNDHLLYSLKDNIIQIDKFPQFFKDQRLPLIQKRLKSQNGNQAKLKYLKKVYDVNFGDLEWLKDNLKHLKGALEEIKHIIQKLIDEYEREIKEAQLLNEIIQQLTLNGLQSLNIGQLDILLGRQCKFINDEFYRYNQINIKLNKFDKKYFQFDEKIFYLEYQKLRKIQKNLRKINDYLKFQKYSTDGREFEFQNVPIMNYSQNDRYYTMISEQINLISQLIIRQQNTLNVTYQLKFKRPWNIGIIRFDPLFNYCIIQYQFHEDNDYNDYSFYYYYSLKNKQFKFIRKFKIQLNIINFSISNLNNIIIILNNSIVIKALNFKNELINEINLKQKGHYGSALFCYGSERNIIVTHFLQKVKIYQETQKQPFLCQQLDTQYNKMELINNDSQLLTQCQGGWRLWLIDYSNQKITLIKKFQRDVNYLILDQFILNQSEFNIIKLSDDKIQILDKNFGEWFGFKHQYGQHGILKLTKHLLLIGNQAIKRRATIDYERLQYDY